VRGPIDVYKFGGAAVGSPEAVRIAGEHVRRASARLVVVVSAMVGITDLLLETAKAALRGRAPSTDEFAKRHIEVIDGVIRAKALRDRLRREVEHTARELQSMCESVTVLHELTPRAADAILARGERMMAQIFAAFVGADYVDATELIFTEKRLGSVWPDFRRSERAAAKVLKSFDGPIVVPGFIATGPDGEVTTLGRGGSDFSAAILARTLKARSVTLFKEVDGLMTADPKSVPNARLLDEVHYREAAELAFYGAKVLHPRTMIPLVDKGIPLFVRNSFQPQSSGTRIAGDVKPGAYPVKALAAIHSQALVAIEGKGMIGVPGVAGRAFTALAQAGHSVSMISQASSESSICFVVPETEAEHATNALEEAFESERRLKLIDRIHAEKRVALIAVVGLGMRGRLGIAARTFSALSGHRVNVVAIAQGSSELNITIAIAEKDATRALVALHNEFQLDKIRPLADTSGRESKLTLLGFGQIGRALVKQLVDQEKPLRAEAGVDLKVIAIADRSGIKVEEEGFTPLALEKLSDHKASGGRLFDRSSPLTLQQVREMMRAELWLLPSHRPILVDLTSEETAPLLQEALENGFHIVLANKKPLAVPQIEYERLFQTARERGLSIRYEATAGAGLPVLDTIAKLQEAGDRVEKIVGCFSGTLGFITTELEQGRRFSEAVSEAKARGYTEPEPLDDLAGLDVARKALILARTLGIRVELADIELEPMATSIGSPSLDADFARRVKRAMREERVLRYIATIAGNGIRVGLEAVPASSPMGSLRGTANQVAIYSKRYKTNPLVVTGPGAGADVTAAGVLNDILAITTQERRR
jgi:aspartokinase/homoserine dehydrogenase 1